MSGVTLANAGLGIVHGFASVIGGFFDIPHGVICGTLAGAATRINIEKIKTDKDNPALEKYAKTGALLTGCDIKDTDKCCNALIEKISEWTKVLKLPPLSDYGMKKNDLDKIVNKTGIKNNPVQLDNNEMKEILLERM